MGYKNLEENRTYHKIYYNELKASNSEKYEERKRKARERYYKVVKPIRDQQNNDTTNNTPRRKYVKRNLKNFIENQQNQNVLIIGNELIDTEVSSDFKEDNIKTLIVDVYNKVNEDKINESNISNEEVEKITTEIINKLPNICIFGCDIPKFK